MGFKKFYDEKCKKKEKKHDFECEHKKCSPIQISLGFVKNGAIAINGSDASDNPHYSNVAQGKSQLSDDPYYSAVAQGKKNFAKNDQD